MVGRGIAARGLRGPSTMRVATGGLAVVLIALTAFSVWTTLTTNRSTLQVLHATQRNDVYQQVRIALVTEQELESQYHQHPERPQSALRQRFDAAAQSLDGTLRAVQQSAAADAGKGNAAADAAGAVLQEIETDHERYREVVDSSFAVAESGDPQGALDIHDQLAGPAFTTVTALVEKASATERKSAAASVASLRQLETSLMVVTPGIFGIGLVLLVICWRVLLGYQRTLKRQADENALQARQLEEAWERERAAEIQHRHAQKLESVGRLAAGIAHEINTPVQFVGDNIRFLQGAFTDLLKVRAARDVMIAASSDPAALEAASAELRALEAAIDLEFLIEEVPLAITQSLEGIGRVATIVRAMKAFGYGNNEDKAPVNLNEAIQNTLVVANSEYKYVADVVTELGELPEVSCHVGDINQVVLNLVVNAAHAIGDRADECGRGVITLTTRVDGPDVVISVTDTGGGIPDDIADKIFEPFFTTKPVGTGTGQGLPLIRSLIMDRHGGAIDFTTDPGVGTTFVVRMPWTTHPADAPVTTGLEGAA
jgi:signal transduction histidine kinase